MFRIFHLIILSNVDFTRLTTYDVDNLTKDT